MLAFAEADAWWSIFAAVGAGIASAFIIWCRRVARWLARKARNAYLEWNVEAVQTHIEPKFEQLRQETRRSAEKLASGLREHTDAEGSITRQIVREELAPIASRFDKLDHDRAEQLDRNERDHAEFRAALLSKLE